MPERTLHGGRLVLRSLQNRDRETFYLVDEFRMPLRHKNQMALRSPTWARCIFHGPQNQGFYDGSAKLA